MLKGIAVSPGVAVGSAYCLNHVLFASSSETQGGECDVAAELAKYEAARERAEEELLALKKKVSEEIGAEGAAIFDAHLAILGDNSFVKSVSNAIMADRQTAQFALRSALDKFAEAFSRFENDYLRERLSDIQDVILRIEGHLSEPIPALEDDHLRSGPLILVADELLPSQVVSLENFQIKGIVTQRGSETSHAAIVARSLGIPSVSGVRGILDALQTGDMLIIDAKAGNVLIHPDPETQQAYLKLEREFFDLRNHLVENREHPAVTADDVPIELLANVNSVHDADASVAMGATGVGLFRTEYLYLTQPTHPSEDKQLSEYREVVQSSPQNRVTIRSLDLGGDKTVPFFGHGNRESNPFMGWRSIRVCMEHPDFLSIQLRAVLGAAALAEELGGEVRLMFPMISTLDEILRAKELVEEAQRFLRNGRLPCADVKIGIMVEVPAAAISIDTLLPHIDFVSIGSNDLVQYLMAADRDNPKVAHLCQPLAPPVLRVLQNVIRACNETHTPVTLCGEMAGQYSGFALLLGMGLRSFSMSPAFVPYIKEFATHMTISESERILKQAMSLATTREVRSYVHSELDQLVPDLARFDAG